MQNKKENREKVTYESDPHNRLVITKNGRKNKLPRFRQVLDGQFKIKKSLIIKSEKYDGYGSFCYRYREGE